MPKPFDATTKHLVEARPADWLAYAGIEGADAEVVDADLSTVTAGADRVLRVKDMDPWLVHLEFQASYDDTLGERMLRYNVLLNGRHDLPVESTVVLLRPAADGSEMTGSVRHQLPSGRRYLEFEYGIVRAWQKPVDAVLAGGLATLPMAPLADVSRKALPGVIRRMEERIRQEVEAAEAVTLWTATFVLMGLRYPARFAEELLQGVRGMKESATYQAILEEGREEGREQGKALGLAEGIRAGETTGRYKEARSLLLLQGSKRFGPAGTQTQAALESIDSLERLESLAERILDVENWEELLA